MILPAADWRGRAGLDALTTALGAEAGEVRFVGGAVRDTLLGQSVADIDLATIHPPEESRRRIVGAGFKAVPTGIAHGTVTAVLPGGPVEVTSLRRDVATDGRHAVVAFTDDWRADAARRDFTINALYAAPGDGKIHDYFGGQADLADGRVRFIGDPAQRIVEDHLRILRFFRFQARFGRGAVDAAGLAACIADAGTLQALSRERIRDELLKLLAVNNPAPTVMLMVENGVLTPVLPSITPLEVARLARLVQREAALNIVPSSLRRLGALLPRDPATADRILTHFRLANAARKRIVAAIAPPDARADQPRPLAYAIGLDAAIDWLLTSSDAASLAELADWTAPRLPFGGGALVARGVTAGPMVAATLQAIERRWIAEGFPAVARVLEIADEEVGKLPSAAISASAQGHTRPAIK